MTDEKMLHALDVLEKLLPADWTSWDPERTARLAQIAHLRTMLPRLRTLIAEGRREKAMRWLGFIQGVVWAMDLATLDALKAMNRATENQGELHGAR